MSDNNTTAIPAVVVLGNSPIDVGVIDEANINRSPVNASATAAADLAAVEDHVDPAEETHIVDASVVMTCMAEVHDIFKLKSAGYDTPSNVLRQLQRATLSADNIGQYGAAVAAVQRDYVFAQNVDISTIGNQRWHQNVTLTINLVNEVRDDWPNFPINWGAAQMRQDIPAALATAFLSAAKPNSRLIGTSIGDKMAISDQVSRNVGGTLLSQQATYDTSAFYGVLFLDALELYEWNRIAVQPHFAAAVANRPFIERNMMPEAAALIATVNGARADAASCALVIPRENISEHGRTILAWVSQGRPFFQPPDMAVGVFPLLNCVTTPRIPIRIYHSEVVPALIAPDANIIPADFIDLAMAVAAFNNDVGSLVRGFMRAAEIYAMRTGAYVAAQANRFFTASFQWNAASWPQPRFANWVWQFLDIVPPKMDVAMFADEAVVFTNASIVMISRLAMEYGAVLSLGVSTFLNNFNIVGSTLSTWRNDLADDWALSPALLFNKFLVGQDICGFFSMPQLFTGAATILAELTGWHWNPVTHSTAAWSNGLHDAPVRALDTVWGALWQFVVPYFGHPAALQWAFSRWASTWGWGSAPVSVDFSHEVVFSRGGGWYAAKGCIEYARNAAGDRPFMFVAYGNCAMNAILWATAQQAQPVWRYQIWDRTSGAKGGEPFADGNEAQLVAPEWVAALHTLNPGQVLSYWWHQGLVVAPYLTAANAGAPHWPRIRDMARGTTVLPQGGMVLASAQELDVPGSRIMDELDMALNPGGPIASDAKRMRLGEVTRPLN
jgi:hypothetical protein